MRCVSYTRTTSCCWEKETPGDVIGQQNTRIQEYAHAMGWKIEKKYSDRKNDPDTHEAFDSLREDGVSRQFDMVIVDSIFRCGSNVSFAKDLFAHAFCPAGIQFAVVEDQYCSIGRSIEEIGEYFREKRNVYMIQYSYRKRMKRYEQGYFTVHDIKFGYKLNAAMNRFEVDDPSAKTVKRVFQLYLSGKNLSKIAQIMNDENVTSFATRRMELRGKPISTRSKWNTKAVQSVLKQEAYIGSFTIHNAKTPLRVEVPQIIDAETFSLCQVKLQPRKVSNKGVLGPRIFSGKLMDGDTGKPMHYYSHTELEGSPRRYHANNKMAGPWIAYETIQQAVAEAILQERKTAERAKQRMESPDGQLWVDRIRRQITIKANEVFSQMGRCVKTEIAAQNSTVSEHGTQKQTLEQLEQAFCQLMEENEQTEKRYGHKNPWLVRYTERPWPVELENRDIKHWVEEIKVFHLKKIVVTLKDQEWREKLPLQWTEEVDRNGEKK